MKYFSILLVICLFASCESQEIQIPNEESPEQLFSIFDDLQVGDKLRYRYMFGYNYYTDEDVLCYTNDTLIVTVEEIDADGIIVMSESLSPFSDQLVLYPDSLYIYNILQPDERLELRINSDSIVVEKGRYSGTTSIHKFLPFIVVDTVKVTFGQWKPNPTIGNYCDELDIRGRTFSDLNVAETNSFALDGPGSTIAYNNEYGVVRVTTYSAWTGQMWGWDRVE